MAVKLVFSIVASAALAAPSLPPSNPPFTLVGSYRLVSATRTLVETGAVEQSFGPQPVGYISYDASGRVMVLIVQHDRPKTSFRNMTDADRLRLFETMASYAGTYRFDGRIVRHDIDMSWNGILTGTTQIRHVRREGDRLVYSTDPGPSPTDGKIITSELIWEKIPASQSAIGDAANRK